MHGKGLIDGMLLLAPNGVHRAWIRDQIPTHMPDGVDWWAMSYESATGGTQRVAREARDLLGARGLAVLAMPYSAIMTEGGRDLAKAFLKKRRCLYVLDEAVRIKDPGTKRAKRVLSSQRYATYKRILTGTPVTQGPFDVYALMKFLDPEYWKKHGLDSFGAFKSYFGNWVTKEVHGAMVPVLDEAQPYHRLDDLRKWIAPMATRVTKAEVLPNLPPKLYKKVYVPLSSEQRRIYEDLKEEYTTVVDGVRVDAPLAVVRLIRLQQVLCGYLPTGDEGDLRPLPGKCPRMDITTDILESSSQQTIVWSRFTRDIDTLCERFGRRGVRYDGRVPKAADRERAVEAFQRGDAQFFFANQAAAGEGLNLQVAPSTYYYSNSYKLMEREQSEDRNHRIGQHHPVQYQDAVAEGTVDEKVLLALRSKMDVASQVTGDKLKEWLI